MTRSLKIYVGRDLSPVQTHTDNVEWPRMELANGGVRPTSSRIIIRDEDGNFGPEVDQQQYLLGYHNVVEVIENATGANTKLFRGRIEVVDTSRGEQVPQQIHTFREHTITVSDYNRDLYGIVVDREQRPEETDKARVEWLVSEYLSGSPRPSTNLGTSYISSSNTILLGSNTYTAMTPFDVLDDIAAQTDKAFFVDVDGNLHYDGYDSTAFLSTLRISDRLTDLDGNTFHPQWVGGTATHQEGMEVLSALRSYWGPDGTDRTVRVTNNNGPRYDYWEGSLIDTFSTTAAQATTRATGELKIASTGHNTITCQIGPIPADRVDEIKAGQRIQVKARAIPNVASTQFRYMPITELRWKPIDGDPTNYMAIVELERAKKYRSRGGGTGGGNSGTAPDPPDPPTGGSGCVTGFTRSWTYDTSVNSTLGDYPWADNWNPSASDAMPAGHGWNGLSLDILGQSPSTIPVNPGDSVNLTGTVSKRTKSLQTAYYTARFFTSPNLSWPGDAILTQVKGCPPSSRYVAVAFDLNWVAPTGATHVMFEMDRQTRVDNVTLTVQDCSGATPSTPGDVPSDVGQPGSGDAGTPGCYATCDHVHGHGMLAGDETNLHDAGQVNVDDAGAYFDGGTVEDVLQEIGASLTSESEDTTATFIITSAPEGGWGRITKHNALSYNGYTYIGYVSADDGDAKVLVVSNDAPETVLTTVTLHAALEVDDHAAPSLLVRDSDHKLLTSYSAHNGTTVYTRLSTTSLDTDPDLGDAFAAEISRDGVLGGSSYTFPSLYQLTAETNDPIWLIYREGANAEWFRSISTDSGATFGAPTKILTESGETPYLKAVGNGVDRIDFVSNELNPSGGDASVWHFYYSGGDFHDSDGTVITLPVDSSDATLVADGSGFNYSFLDIAIDTDNNPVIAFADLADLDNHVYHWTKWSGTTWSGSIIAEAGAGIDSTQTYSPHLALDASNPSTVYASRENADGFYDLWRYTTTNGLDWFGTRVREGTSGDDNIRPQSVRNHEDALAVVWMAGTFTGFTTWDTGISGAGVSATAGVTDHGALTGLGDDDHTQYTRKDTLTTTGDIYYASGASTPARRAIGSTGDVLTVSGGVPTWAAPTAGSSGVGELLIADVHSTPLVFDDILQNDDGDNFLYADA